MNLKKIVVGTELFSGDRNKKYSLREIRYFLNKIIELGINQVDTAPSYGKNNFVEKMIGKSIEYKRHKYIISSKFLNYKCNNSKKRIESVKEEFEKTLYNLNTNYVDNYFFHSGVDKDFFDDKVWYYLNDLKKKKYIKKLGLSIKHNLVKKNSISQITHSKDFGISIISTTLNMFSKESLNKVIPYCKSNNIKVWGRMPLAKGLLSGKYRSIKELDNNDFRLKSNKKLTKSIINFSLKNNIDTKKAINWSSKHTDKIIIGFKNINQIRDIFKL